MEILVAYTYKFLKTHPKKLLGLINKLSKVVEYRINTHKSVMSVFYGNEFEFYSVREHREPSLVLCDNLERWDGSREGGARGRVCVSPTMTRDQ